MISKRLRIAYVGDIHLVHPKTPTEHILKVLRSIFPDTEATGELDIIFFGGDLYDRQIQLSDLMVPEIMIWMSEIILICAKRHISLRVLEGTPSHDWKQPRLFLTVAKLLGVEVDLLYIDDVRIEQHPSGCTILYIPDEWRPDTDDTYKDVLRKFAENGVDKVDIAVMHGAFEYQLPAVARSPKHNSERYLDLVRHYIMISHIHKNYPNGRILPAGSLDRLAHGEEEPKGHYRITIDPKYGDQLVFVENKNAYTYLTVDCCGLPLQDAFDKLHLVQTLRKNSHVRIRALRDDPILVNVELLRRQYPHIQWSSLVESGIVATQANLLVDLRSQYKEIQLTAENIPPLLRERLVRKNIPPEVIDRGLGLLQQAIQR